MITCTTQGAVSVLSIDSTLGEEKGSELLDRANELPRIGRTLVVLDMAACPLIDSSGCEALLDFHEMITSRDGLAHLACVAPLCHDVLYATGVGRRFESFPGVREAVLDLAK